MDQKENLRGLENLMNEFFSPSTSNERKREIEKILESFTQQYLAWRDCLYFLFNSNNHYVCMFCLTTLEEVIRRRWLGMETDHKTEFRTKINKFLSLHVGKNSNLPSFIRNKVMKLVVDIARSDWPHFYPGFFTEVMQLIHSEESCVAGLTLLLIACEELATPRDDLSTSRAGELKKLMNQHVSHSMLAITNILESILERDLGGVNTPPPSPSLSGDSDDTNSMDGSQPGEAKTEDGPISTSSPLRTSIQLGSSKVGTGSQQASRKPSPVINPLDPESAVIVSLCLRIFAQILSWAHLPSALNSRVISVLFHYAAYAIKIKMEDQVVTNISVLAMIAVNEIMAKNYIPVDFQDYLINVYRSAYQILQGLLQEAEQGCVMDLLDGAYLEKITEFIQYFISFHLKRCEDNLQFPLMEFLSLVYKYTLQQSQIQGFHSCLDIWNGLTEYIQGSRDLNREAGMSLVLKYQEALLSLVVELLKKIQFRYNSHQLLELDSESLDENSETEWQKFLVAAIELVMKVADLLPKEVLHIIDVVWKETCCQYVGLDKQLTAVAVGPGMGNVAGHPSQQQEVVKFQLSPHDEENSQLLYLLRDFCTLLQLMGRLSALFIGEEFIDRLPDGLVIVKQLLSLTEFGSRSRLFACHVERSDIRAGFVEAHAQTLGSLKAWCHWLAALHSEALNDSTHTWVCSFLTSRIVAAVVGVLSEYGDDPELDRIKHAAAHFLVTLTGTVRPPSIWKLKHFTELYRSINQLRLKPDTRILLVRSLCNILLLTWPGIQEQKWDERKKHLSKFLRDLTEDFRSLKNTSEFPSNKAMQKQAEPVIDQTLLMLGDLVENVLNEVTQTKKLCYDAVGEYIDISLWLFPLYIQVDHICERMFQFFHIVFDVLKSQMGSVYVETAVQTFLNLFGEQQLSQAIVQGGTTGAKVVERFLSILTFIVCEPSPAFRKFVGSSLTLCLNHILPLVAHQPVSDIRMPMYNLLYHTLLNNWQYFFKSKILGSLQQLGGNAKVEEVEHQEIFLQALKAFGQSFMQPDIAVFKQNVLALEELNQKWRLYSKQIFRETLLAEFLSVLLQVLVAKSHNLLREEIGVAVYNMAATDFNTFFAVFIPSFLAGTAGTGAVGGLDENQQHSLADSFKHETDLPSFTANLDRFITDLRFYQIVNSGLPSASVKF